jgi:hypothetical protein
MLSESVTVRNAVELAAVARHHLAEVEMLFDNRLLEGWAQGEARERLAALAAHVDEATTRLAAFDEPTSPVCPSWLRERLGEDAGLIVFRPLDWLLLRDRAALAVAALGGILSQRATIPSGQAIIDMPLDVDLNLPIRLGPASCGDIPTHAILRTVADGNPRCAVISSDDPDVAIAHFPKVEVDDKGGRLSLRLALLQAQPTGAQWEIPTTIDVRMASGARREGREQKKEAKNARHARAELETQRTLTMVGLGGGGLACTVCGATVTAGTAAGLDVAGRGFDFRPLSRASCGRWTTCRRRPASSLLPCHQRNGVKYSL